MRSVPGPATSRLHLTFAFKWIIATSSVAWDAAGETKVLKKSLLLSLTYPQPVNIFEGLFRFIRTEQGGS